MSVAKILENMEILIFHGDGTPKSTEEILKEIQEKIIINTKGDENMTNKYENREDQDERVYLRDIVGNLIEIKEILIYEVEYATSKGFTGVINYLKQASLKLDIGIYDLKNIDEDFEYKICEINKAIDALCEATEKIQGANEIFIRMEVINIKDKIENEIIKLKLFDETWNDKKVETTEIDPPEEEKKENEVSENKKEEISEKDTTTPIFNFDTEEMKEKGMYFSGMITPFCGIDFAANKKSVTPFFVNPNVTLTVNGVKKYFEEYSEQSKLNVSEAINKPNVELKGKYLTDEVKKLTFDEVVLNENIETMRKEIKQIVSDKLLNIEPMEKAETITKLSKEIRECINMKNYIEISNRHRANEDDR